MPAQMGMVFTKEIGTFETLGSERRPVGLIELSGHLHVLMRSRIGNLEQRGDFSGVERASFHM